MWSIKWIITISNLLTPVNTAQNTVGVLCCWGLWLACVHLAVHQDSLPTELLSRQSVPSQGCFLPRCSTSYLSLLNFLSFLLAHSSSWSLWMAPLICIVSTVSPLLPQVWCNLGIWCEWHSVASSRSFMKMINRTALSTEPCDIPLVTTFQVEDDSVTTTFEPDQFFNHPNLDTIILWETVLKALL